MTGVRALSAGMVAALCLGLTSLPASAKSTTIHDPAGDNTYYEDPADYGDLTTIVVRHTKKAVRVEIAGRYWDGLNVFLDTKAKRTGPELLISWEQYLGEEVFLSTTEKSWEVARGNISCRRAKPVFGDGKITFVVPRTCLAKKGVKPRRLRLNVESVNFEDTVPRDVAPAYRTFGSWVKAG